MDQLADDPVARAWENAALGAPLSPDELELAEEGLAAIERGELVAPTRFAASPEPSTQVRPECNSRRVSEGSRRRNRRN